MDLKLASEAAELVAALDAVLAKESSAARVRAAEPLGFDRALWLALNDLGIPVLALDADVATDELLAALAETAGKYLASAPIVETLVTASLLAHCPGDGAAAVATLVNEGAIATIVLREVSDHRARLVPAGAIADIVIAFDGSDLTAVIETAPMVAVPNVGSLPLADRDLRNGERVLLATGADAQALYMNALRQWQLLTSAAVVGLSGSALNIAVDYVKGRVIFDRPVASFQTVAHRLADHATDLDGARLLVQEAAWAGDIGSDRARTLATMAFCFTGEKATAIVGDALHYHGGYGFTLEYDIQLYYRRARAYPQVWGGIAQEWQALADELYGQGS
jgi:alkylation response protein AidB-like acyl-CoA dehydrogenase